MTVRERGEGRTRTRDGSRGRSSLRRDPVVETLAAMTAVSALLWLGRFVGLVEAFVLAPPVLRPPWALPASVYAHVGVAHLLSNALVVALAGSVVSRSTTRIRFHAFFLTTGAAAGVGQVWVASLFGPPTAVLGASGATFALVGYVLASNPASGLVFDLLPTRAAVLVAASVAVGLTLTFSAPGSALVAHLFGAALGLLAGRVGLLRA